MPSRAALRLTPQQREFVELHVVDGIPLYRSFLRAFETRCAAWKSSSNTRSLQLLAASRAGLLMKRDYIQEYVLELKTKMERKANQSRFLSLEEKREFLAAAVRTPIGEIDETSPLAQEIRDTPQGRVIKSVDKLRALESDAKLAGELRDRVDITLSPKVIDLGDSLL